MAEEQELYLEIGKKLKGAEESRMFGKPCFKVRRKGIYILLSECNGL